MNYSPPRSLRAIPSSSDFFFSSRRRHTRLQGDWSSDVCSSDLVCSSFIARTASLSLFHSDRSPAPETLFTSCWVIVEPPWRSEERRVGKECGSRWWAYSREKNVYTES